MDPEFRHLNLGSVWVTLDLTSRKHSFNADLAQEHLKTMFFICQIKTNPNVSRVQAPELRIHLQELPPSVVQPETQLQVVMFGI